MAVMLAGKGNLPRPRTPRASRAPNWHAPHSTTADEGTITYLALKPGTKQPEPKLSYVARFAPWQVVFIAGAWTHDLDASYRLALFRLGSIGGTILAAVLLVAWFINRDISGSLGKLKAAMEKLALGELSTDIPGIDRRDEVGAMAVLYRYSRTYGQGGTTGHRAEEDQLRSVAEKQAALISMADKIEIETTDALQEVGAHTSAMTATAKEMSASAVRTGNSAGSAATASAQALSNAQTVASASEQLSASIREIGSQVAQSTEIVGRAVEAGAETRQTIEALNEQVGHIGAVADMIGEIAAKTNLWR